MSIDPQQFVVINEHAITVEMRTEHTLLAEFYEQYRSDRPAEFEATIKVISTEQGLFCEWYTGAKKPLTLSIDVKKFVARQKSFPAGRQGVFNQALGKRCELILDSTCGWGGDAMLMCAQGYKVEVIERHPLMALLLQDAMRQLAQTAWARANKITVPRVNKCDAIDFLRNHSKAQLASYDCVYIDPMFPPKRKSTAVPTKEIQFLQYLLGPQADAQDLAMAAINSQARRAVIKRPRHASPLVVEPDERFSGKLVHYDVYLNKAKDGAAQ